MKNLLIISLSALAFACSKDEVQATEPVEACCSANGECTAAANAMQTMQGEVASLDMKRSPYDFSGIIDFRRSVLVQADIEGLDMDSVVEAVDNLLAKLIDENMQDLEKCETESQADEAMMKLVMKAFAAKKLTEIFDIKEDIKE
ncbi:MAG: hypothetical protein R3Y46_06470 [Opitutales bacterium]